jgi:hypothetical protein
VIDENDSQSATIWRENDRWRDPRKLILSASLTVLSEKDDSQHESEETWNGWKPSVEQEKLPGLAAGQFFFQVVSEMTVNGLIVLANLCSRRKIRIQRFWRVYIARWNFSSVYRLVFEWNSISGSAAFWMSSVPDQRFGDRSRVERPLRRKTIENHIPHHEFVLRSDHASRRFMKTMS